MQWVLTLVAFAALYVFSNVYTLLSNYYLARKSGLPVHLCPVNAKNVLWIVFSLPLKPLMHRYLPTAIYQRVLPTIYGWEFETKYDAHAKRGSTFMIAHPGGTDLWIADPTVANDLLTRRKDFCQVELSSKIAGLFGQNIITSDGEAWQRQRRLITPNFNEGVSGLVWEESFSQAQDMLNHFLMTAEGVTTETIDGLRRIAINVLGAAGYGMPQRWKPEEQGGGVSAGPSPFRPDEPLTYIEAISSVIDNLLPAAMLPAALFSSPIMPQSLRQLGRALREYRTCTKDMLDQERRSAHSDQKSSRENLMSQLVRLSDKMKQEGEDQNDGSTIPRSSQSLSEDEISGNLFLFTVAGFDTTANAMAYAVTLLAAYPKVQEWVIEEIDAVFGKGVKEMDYAMAFPKLKRCLALMFETLRLYPPLVHVARAVGPVPQVLRSSSSPSSASSSTITHLIPAHTTVYINNVALHTDPSVWGPDALVFRPSRWLTKGNSDEYVEGKRQEGEEGDEEEQLITPPRCTFLPWSGGPRICPGMKMAQVEFVAVMAGLLRNGKLVVIPHAPTKNSGSDEERARQEKAARDRLLALMQDSSPRLTLQMNRPGR